MSCCFGGVESGVGGGVGGALKPGVSPRSKQVQTQQANTYPPHFRGYTRCGRAVEKGRVSVVAVDMLGATAV